MRRILVREFGGLRLSALARPGHRGGASGGTPRRTPSGVNTSLLRKMIAVRPRNGYSWGHERCHSGARRPRAR
jgi:hypothetical protein